MNIERETKLSIAIHYADLVKALKHLHPDEFLLNQLPADSKAVQISALPKGVLIEYLKKSQGPAEIDFNRQQRVVEADPA